MQSSDNQLAVEFDSDPDWTKWCTAVNIEKQETSEEDVVKEGKGVP